MQTNKIFLPKAFRPRNLTFTFTLPYLNLNLNLPFQAPVDFRRKFVALSICLDNVYVASEEYELDSAGENQFAIRDMIRLMSVTVIR